MNSNRLLVFLIHLTACLLLSSQNSFGQSIFLDKGENGFGIETYYSTGEGTNTVGGSGGFSVDGIFDVQLTIASMSFPEEDFGNNFKALILAPGIAYNVLKQSNKIPVTLQAALLYGHYEYSGGVLSSNDLEMKGSSIIFGFGVFHEWTYPINVDA